MGTRTIVAVDLDETLVHCDTAGRCARLAPRGSFQMHRETYRVYVRPGAEIFLRRLQGDGHVVGVWTAATRLYATRVLRLAFPWFQPAFLLARAECRLCDGRLVKDLRVFAVPMLLVDDNAHHREFNEAARSAGAVVLCSPYDPLRPDPGALARVLREIRSRTTLRGRDGRVRGAGTII